MTPSSITMEVRPTGGAPIAGHGHLRRPDADGDLHAAPFATRATDCLHRDGADGHRQVQHHLAAPVAWSFTTTAPAGTYPATLWDTSRHARPADHQRSQPARARPPVHGRTSTVTSRRSASTRASRTPAPTSVTCGRPTGALLASRHLHRRDRGPAGSRSTLSTPVAPRREHRLRRVDPLDHRQRRRHRRLLHRRARPGAAARGGQRATACSSTAVSAFPTDTWQRDELLGRPGRRRSEPTPTAPDRHRPRLRRRASRASTSTPTVRADVRRRRSSLRRWRSP